MWKINKEYAREFAIWANDKYPFFVSLAPQPDNAKETVYHFTAFENEELSWKYLLERLEEIYGKPTGKNILCIVSVTYQETCYGRPSGPLFRVSTLPPVALKYPEELEAPGILEPYNPEDNVKRDDRYGLTKLSILYQIHELQTKLNTLETYIQRVL